MAVCCWFQVAGVCVVVVGCWLPGDVDSGLLVVVSWLLVVDCCSLLVGCWLVIADFIFVVVVCWLLVVV